MLWLYWFPFGKWALFKNFSSNCTGKCVLLVSVLTASNEYWGDEWILIDTISVSSYLFVWVTIITTFHTWDPLMQLQPSLSTSDPTNCVQTRRKSSLVQGISVMTWPALLWCAVSRQQVSRKRIIMTFGECSKLWICIYCQGISQFCLALCPRNLPSINCLRTIYMRHRLQLVVLLSPSCHLMGWVGTWGKCRATYTGQGRGDTQASGSGCLQQSGLQNLCISRLIGTLQVSNVSLPISGLVSHHFLIIF